MKDFLKISTIYIVMWGMMYAFENKFETTSLNILMYFIIQNIVLISLFNMLKLNSTDIILFCGLITVFLMLMALECNVIFTDSSEIINVVKSIIPLQIIELIVKISRPFFTIFVILNNLNLVTYSVYIVPMYMCLLAYISINNVDN